jgi:ribonuclease HI
MGKSKFYVVWTGNKPGIYTSWADCKMQVDGFTGARYKAFNTFEEASSAFMDTPPPIVPKSGNQAGVVNSSKTLEKPIPESLSVDAACSGNPGVMEYRGVYTKTGEVLFHQKFPLGTNNIGEFLALVHGLALLNKRGINIPVYTDSMTALSWLRQKKCKTLLQQSPRTIELFDMVARAEKWLHDNKWSQPVLKWNTEAWGEIPADFGRKG